VPTRMNLLRAWLAYYKRKGMATPSTLMLCEANLGLVRGRMILDNKKERTRSRRLLDGMVYGIHLQCRSMMLRTRGGG